MVENPDRTGTLLVPLTRGYFAIIDERDAAIVGAKNWSVRISPRSNVKYAETHVIDSSGKDNMLTLHRLVWQQHALPATPEIDHRNTDGLDCRLENLRAATPAQNRQHRSKIRTNTSGHKGVYFSKARSKWAAAIRCNNKRVLLGFFDEVTTAAAAYAKAASEMHGEFALT